MAEDVEDVEDREHPGAVRRHVGEDDQPDALRHEAGDIRPPAPEVVRDEAQQEAPRDLQRPVGRDGQAGVHRREADVLEMRHLVHDPDVLRGAAEGDRRCQQIERRRVQRLGHGHPARRREVGCGVPPPRRLLGIDAVRVQPVGLGAVAQHERHRQANDEDGEGGDDERATPPELHDQRGDDGGDHVAAGVAGEEHPHRARAAALEPVHDRCREGREPARALADGDDHARGVVVPDRLCRREVQHPDEDDQQAADRHLPRTEAVDQVAGERGHQPGLEGAQRVADRDHRDGPAQLVADWPDEDAETEADDAADEEVRCPAGQHDVPAVEQRPTRQPVDDARERPQDRPMGRAPRFAFGLMASASPNANGGFPRTTGARRACAACPRRIRIRCYPGSTP